ncbi:MAG: polysaccharide pyruvyl transferase family protein [Cyclobacteriaceae bacterium]
MKLFKNFNQHVPLFFQSVYDLFTGAIPYVGYPENKNLGDVELLNIAKKHLPYKRYAYNVGKRGRYVRLAVGRNKYFIVGGGTLMFSRQILDECLILTNLGLVPIFMGTGSGEVILDVETVALDWKEVLSKSPFLGVRGEFTIRALKKIGIDGQLCGDLGYLLNLDFEKPSNFENYVVITPRSIRPTVYEYYEEDFETRKKLKFLIEQLINKGIRVIVNAVSIDDYKVVKAWVKSIRGPIEYIEYNDDFQKYVDLLSKARLLVSMRMHPGIFALAMGVFPFELDGRIKFKDSFSLIENESEDSYCLIDPSSITAEALTSKVLEKYYSENDDTRLHRFKLVSKLAQLQRSYCKSLPT